MASEPLFEEQSDAVKVSETPYPTNGSGKNLAKNTGVKYVFAVILCRILRYHSSRCGSVLLIRMLAAAQE